MSDTLFFFLKNVTDWIVRCYLGPDDSVSTVSLEFCSLNGSSIPFVFVPLLWGGFGVRKGLEVMSRFV